MTPKQTATLPPETVKELLGYLNFSSGNRDSRFFQALNSLYRGLAPSNKDTRCSAVRAIEFLEQQLALLANDSEAFRPDDQAGLVLALVRKHFIPGYRQYHADLLFHQTDEILFNSLLLGKVLELVLQQGGPWTEHDRIVSAVIEQLDDYIGYRPIPVLEGAEKHQPYAHEWVAPIPLYMDEVGVAAGKYEEVVDQALLILRETDPQILREACLDPEKIEELVLDPRAYDFDHPVNRKPNYHFGLWDPNYIDNSGFYRRFVVHQVTLDGILRRLQSAYTGESQVADVPLDELIYEAGAVLAGTMLMGAGVCGDTPSSYDSETSLNDLMPVIADYRDRFYQQLLQKIPNKMKPRIQREQERLFQPFGGCRQDLNRQMAKRRADQMQRMLLARIFARMGYSDAAMKQANSIAVTSSRIFTTIDCLITETHTLIDQNKLTEAAKNLPQIEDLIRRGIACGAIIDPWTILGFGGVFSLFHTIENSIQDHRIDDLINLLEETFDIYSRLQKEAAASGNGDLQADLSDRMSDLAGWWDQYGTTDVNNVDSFSGEDAWESAAVVSTALAAWHKAGTAAGDVAFWSRHVERFKTTKAFVLLAEALLDQQDPVASMNLLMHWLDHAAKIPLVESDYSFHAIAVRWMDQLWKPPKSEHESAQPLQRRTLKEVPPLSFAERWKLTRKFFELLEANADIYWLVPEIELDDDQFEGGKGKRKGKKKPPK
ncbi:MAG: coiled-coil domain-containing protein, partial [Planctomycetaceae bacterium]|nr:coiled-coil domain-containing protein [Planctomycetaceae bacterium]